MDYSFDVYLEFVPMLCATTSPSEYYEWEDAIINCYSIGELPLNQLANLAKRSFSISVSLWFRRMQLEHGDDYCTSWYAMKEALRRRFAPPFEPEKNILSSSGSSDLVASKFSSATPFEKNNSTNQPAIMGLPSDIPTATSIVGEDVPLNTSISDISSPLEQQAGVPEQISIDERVDLSLASGLHATDSSCDTQPDIKIDDNDVASNGLSMMAREVHSDGTTIDVRGQRSNIFHSECKVHDKVCKLIIDGGSFTNVISSDLVHALSLSTWRLPSPCYMQWMNKSGTLKITHRARVKFSMGNYVDSVDCNVVPMNACHLLLSRPWQFDLDATHGGRSNTYSFIHKGVHHILKPMKKSDIKAHVFAGATRKKSGVYTTSKSRTTLIQGEGNDVALSSEIIACESSSKGLNSMVASARTFDDISNNVTVPAPIITTSISDALVNKDDVIKDVPTTCVVSKIDYMNPDSNIVPTREYMIGVVQYMPKPRMALFKGGEDDELMVHQNILAGISSGNNLKDPLFIKLGAFSFGVKQNLMKEGSLAGTATLSDKIIFNGDNLHKEQDMCEFKKPPDPRGRYIHIGCVRVNIIEKRPSDQVHLIR